MFLSNFSIKQPVTTVAIIIVLMCLGLLALKNLRVNQIPDVEQPVMVVNVPVSRAPRPRRSSARSSTASRSRCRAFRRSTRSARRPSERQRADRHHLQLQEEHGRRRPTRSATPSPRCATSCRSRCASRCCTASIRPRSRSCSWRCRRTTQTHAEISRLAEDVLADRFRGIDGVAVVNVERLAAARAVGAAARARSCASTTSR